MQALGAINCVQSISRVLIVTKASLKANWYRECVKWLTRKMSVGVVDPDCFPSTDVVIINYDLCKKFARKLEFMWDLVVLDEAHQIKNSRTQRAKSVVGYKPSRAEAAAGMLPSSGIPARRKLALTGTPFENRPVELYTIIKWLLGDQCISKSAYEARFCGAKMTSFGWQANGATHLEELNQWLRERVMIRRLKKDVLLELPLMTRVIIELDPESAAAAVTNEKKVCAKYEADLARAQVDFELIKCMESDMEYEAARKKLNQQFYIPFIEIAKVRHETALAKVPLAVKALNDDIEEMGGSSKILCFAHHADVLEGLAKEFPQSVTVTGAMSLADRDAKVQRFQNDPKCGPFFGSIRATGEGLTLTAASLVVFVEEDWVPGKLSQCEARAHRIGQHDNVLVKHLVLKGTMDAKMVTTTVRKQEILDASLDDLKQDEMLTEPVLVPRHEPLATRKGIRVEASIVSEVQKQACLAAVQDFVEQLRDSEDVGEVDLAIAKELAALPVLNARQAVLARKVCYRYQKLFQRDMSDCGGRNLEQKETSIF